MIRLIINTVLFLAINQIAFGQSNEDVFRDSIKNLIVGEWEYKSHEIKLAEHLNYYEEIPDFAKRRLKRIAGAKIEKALKVEFNQDDRFKVSNSEEEIEYEFSIHEKFIWISRSDYVITLYYDFDDKENLLLTSKPVVGESKVKFKKK